MFLILMSEGGDVGGVGSATGCVFEIDLKVRRSDVWCCEDLGSAPP